MAEYIERSVAIARTVRMECEADCPGIDFAEVRKMLANIPAADVAPVIRGRWIPNGYTVCCSECKTMGSPQWKGCPVCLARMDGE